MKISYQFILMKFRKVSEKTVPLMQLSHGSVFASGLKNKAYTETIYYYFHFLATDLVGSNINWVFNKEFNVGNISASFFYLIL